MLTYYAVRLSVVAIACALLIATVPASAVAFEVRDIRGVRNHVHEVHVIEGVKPVKSLHGQVGEDFDWSVRSGCNSSVSRGVGLPIPAPGFCNLEDDPEPEPEGKVMISEIMYSLPGTDAGREWVEIFNGTNAPVDIAGWMFVESGSDHAFVLVSGSTIIPVGEAVVVADNSTLFMADWPDFQGTLLDSAFSLLNAGETLGLKNSQVVLVDEIAYTSADGANGDGNSLHRSDDALTPGAPTPGL